MTRPFLSIVTISFNQATHLPKCVESVLSQKGKDVEYIVVDAGSTDGSREILKSYGDAIDHLVFEPDKGPAEGLNKGFARAQGEIAYFINSDDFMLPRAVESMRQLWASNKGIDILLGGAWMVDSDGGPIRELFATAGELEPLLAGTAPMVQQGLSFRMTLFRQVGGFEIMNQTCWDYELLCAMLSLKPSTLLTRTRFGAFRVYGKSLSGGAGGSAHLARYQSDLDRIHRKFVGRPARTRSTNRTRLARLRRALQDPVSFAQSFADTLVPARIWGRWRKDVRIDGQ